MAGDCGGRHVALACGLPLLGALSTLLQLGCDMMLNRCLPPCVSHLAPTRSGELAGKEEALTALQGEKEELEGKHTELRCAGLGWLCAQAAGCSRHCDAPWYAGATRHPN